MSGTLGSAASKAGDAAQKNPLADVARSEAADRLKGEVQDYLAAQATRLLTGLGTKLGETTGRLNDIAEGNSPGFAKLALDGGRKLAEGKSPMRAAVEVGAGKVKDNVVGAFKNLTGGTGRKKGGGGQKPTVIIEYVDVGVPLRTAYDQWTQYQDFSTFAKGVKSANRADDTTSDWQLKVLWSNRSWKATTTEQVPDDRISWTSEGAKGSTKGVVSFHELAPSLTRVVLVIEYYPSGLFEKTGNIWRAQGRRARLDLKHYVRHITLKGEAEDGWRGEIRDGEVVRSHEDAVAREEEERQDQQDGPEDRERAPGTEDSHEGDSEEEPEEEPEDAYEEAAPEGEPEEGYEDEEGPEGEYDEESEGEYDEESEDGYDEAPEEDEEAGEDEDASREEYEDAEGGSRR